MGRLFRTRYTVTYWVVGRGILSIFTGTRYTLFITLLFIYIIYYLQIRYTLFPTYYLHYLLWDEVFKNEPVSKLNHLIPTSIKIRWIYDVNFCLWFRNKFA